MNHGPKSNEKEECRSDPNIHNKYKEIMSVIPRRKGNWTLDLYQYEGFWCGPYSLEGMLMAQDHFKPQPNQVILSSTPKSGTTWLKALSFAILTRSSCDQSTNPLLTRMAHDLKPRPSAMEDFHLEDAFEFFCEGLSPYGPYWDHLLGYWRASLESLEGILFLKCEDLKNESIYWVKKMAQFMGYPFSFEEDDKGMNNHLTLEMAMQLDQITK
ncbi:hypothetical protein ACJW30_08G158100 [Castanea mollissima]